MKRPLIAKIGASQSQVSEETAGDIPDNPINPFEKPVPRSCTATYDSPVAGADRVKLQVFADAIAAETALDVLFVAENQ